MYKRLPGIAEELKQLSNLRHRFFVLFNSGLHDQDKLCLARGYRVEFLNVTDDESFSCFQAYEDKLPHFVEMILEFPAELHVWQTTTAAWPKWGNAGLSVSATTI